MAIWLVLLVLQVSTPLDDSFPPIGIIDFYGLGAISERQVRDALQIKEGDTFSEESREARRRLEALPGIAQARLELACCEAGKSILYVGLQHKGAPALVFRPAPRGAIRLPLEIVKAGQDFEAALGKAIIKGDAAEDRSQGHALGQNPELRAVQERFVSLANRNLSRLRDVLRKSADPDQRALAAQVIAYVDNKEAIVRDLVQAMHDPDADVRNNSMRALAVMADFSHSSPKKRHIPATPFVEMLSSIEWTDRNKASFALLGLTADRDPKILSELRARALTPLTEMARWKTPGHAQAAFALLGRIAGFSEERILAAWNSGDREAVIAAASR